MTKPTKEALDKFEKQFAKTKRLHAIHHEWIKKQNEVLKGYELMESAEEFAKKYPECKIVHVDDDYHSSSVILIVPHQNEDQYMGLSCTFIPQCTGENPIRFFLYPNALNSLLEALEGFKGKGKDEEDE